MDCVTALISDLIEYLNISRRQSAGFHGAIGQ